MGNRAVIAHNTGDSSPVIYLHWNGGRASVEAFLKIAHDLGIPKPNAAGLDELAEILATHFFDTQVGMTVYRETYGRADTDNWDNGVYLIDAHWNIVGRNFLPEHFQEEVDTEKTRAIYEEVVGSVAKTELPYLYVQEEAA